MNSDIDTLLDFCNTYPVGSLESGLRRRLLTTFSSGSPVVLVEDGELALVAAVADRLQTGSRCVLFELLGLRSVAAPDLLRVALKQAEDQARGGAHIGIETNLSAAPALLEASLPHAGYHRAFTSYQMETPVQPAPAPAPLPGPQWRWVNAAPAHASDFHRTLTATMGDVPGSYMTGEAELAVALATYPDSTWLLLQEEVIAGFCRIRRGEHGWGEVELLGRHPSRRGQGLGPLVLGKAMALLEMRGARRFRLDVATENRAALTLYQRCGFVVTAEETTWRKHLR